MKLLITALVLILTTNSYSYESKIISHFGLTARIDNYSGKIDNHYYGKNNYPIILEPHKKTNDKFPLYGYKSHINMNVDSPYKLEPVDMGLTLTSYSKYNGFFSYRLTLYFKNNFEHNRILYDRIIFNNNKKDYCSITGELVHLKNGKSKIIMDNYDDIDSCNLKLVLGDDNSSLSLYVRDDIKNVPVTIYKVNLLNKEHILH